MGCVDMVGPGGGAVSETEIFTSKNLEMVEGRMLPLRNVWANFDLSFMTGAKGHLLSANFFDFVNEICTLKVQVKGSPSQLPSSLDYGSKKTKK